MTLRHIACIDDEPDILEITKMSLEMVGDFEVMTFESGRKALNALKSFTPDLILLDAMMPEMGGAEAFVELRKLSSLAGTPIVFITARAQPRELQEYIAMGAAGVISKPFDPISLPVEVSTIWERWITTESVSV